MKFCLPHVLNHTQKIKESRESDLYICKWIYNICYCLSLLLSRKEKERLVIKCAQEGKTTREIAKLVHMSLQDIGKIIRAFTGDKKESECNKIQEKKEEEKRLAKLSTYAQAFQLFREKKTLTDVVIKLDLDADTVLYHYKDYLRLNDMYELVNVYHSLGQDLPLFLHLFNRVKKEDLNREEITDMLQTQRNVADMQETLIWLNNDVPELKREKQKLEEEIARLCEIKDSLENR